MEESSSVVGWILFAALAGGLVVASIIWGYFRNVTFRGPGTDPIIEAGFYFAYGQKKRAIEILEKARLAQPERQDLTQRLAELRRK
jgi:hypothetical protein